MEKVTRAHLAGLELATFEIEEGILLYGVAARDINKLIAHFGDGAWDILIAHRLIDMACDTSTDWRDGMPPEDLSERCGTPIDDAFIELAFSAACVTDLIAQASAAPEQESVAVAVAWGLPDPEPAGRPFLLLVHSPDAVARPDELVPLYIRPDTEIDRLRAALREAQALLRYSNDVMGSPLNKEIDAHMEAVEAFLSATAQPAEPHDAETDDDSCPECEGARSDHCGPCRQCGGEGTFEAALRHAQPAERLNAEEIEDDNREWQSRNDAERAAYFDDAEVKS